MDLPTAKEVSTVVDKRLEQTVRQHARDIDRLLGYLKHETQRYMNDAIEQPTDWGYAGSLGRTRGQLLEAASSLSGQEVGSIDDLINLKAESKPPMKIPAELPVGYSPDYFRGDLEAFHEQIDRRILDGYSYLVSREYGMAGAMFDDVSDMQHASELLQDGEFSRAASYIRNWDTIVRDQVPQRLYEMLYRP